MHPAKCINLGDKLEGEASCWRRCLHKCDYLNKNIVPMHSCIPGCGGYEAEYDLDAVATFTPGSTGDMHSRLVQQSRLRFPMSSYKVDTGTRGVIYVGGGKYWDGIVTGLMMLRDVSCHLPVEIWYRGRSEKVYEEDIQGLGEVTLVDIDEMKSRAGDSTNIGGWEAKLYALFHTTFEQVLFLDADAYVVSNPEPMFGILKSTGFAYWKDVESQRKSIKWTEVYAQGERLNLNPIQGGQFLINRSTQWRLIHLAHWMCEHSSYYFSRMFGEQDTWRVAIAVLNGTNTPVQHYMIDSAKWHCDVAFVCFYHSVPMIVHRCQGKLFSPEYIPQGKVKYANPQYRLPSECRLFDLYSVQVNRRGRDSVATFREIYNKRLWGTSRPSGAGTTLRESQLYIDTVNHLARQHGWKTCIDLGSGDCLVGSKLEIENYIGYDCVEAMVTLGKARYEGEWIVGRVKVKRNYNLLDFFNNCAILECAEVCLIKDLLHHIPTAMVVSLLDSLIKSNKWKAIVLCQDDNQIHPLQDCPLGGYRALNPSMTPLSNYPITQVTKVHHKSLCLIRLE